MTVAKVASAEDAEIACKENIKDRAHRFFADSSLPVAEVKHYKKCVFNSSVTTNSKSSCWIKEYLVFSPLRQPQVIQGN